MLRVVKMMMMMRWWWWWRWRWRWRRRWWWNNSSSGHGQTMACGRFKSNNILMNTSTVTPSVIGQDHPGTQAGPIETELAVGRWVRSRMIRGDLFRPLPHSPFVEVTLTPLRSFAWHCMLGWDLVELHFFLLNTGKKQPCGGFPY